MSLEIIIGADISPALDSVTHKTATPKLGSGMSEIWQKAEARIFNLQYPVTGDAQELAALSPTGISLCTNRIADAGADGIAATRTVLKANKIAFFGAGEDLDAADQPFFFVRHGVRVCIYAVCESERASATQHRAGANPLDMVNISDRVREIKSNCDRLIVLYYGGSEGYPYPTPKEQKICRKIAECGASLVLSQGSHTIGCAERWNNTTILYGQGAFLPENSGTSEKDGLLVRYTIGDYGADTVEFMPIVSLNGTVTLADEAKSAELLQEFEKRSLRVRVEGFVPARFENQHISA